MITPLNLLDLVLQEAWAGGDHGQVARHGLFTRAHQELHIAELLRQQEAAKILVKGAFRVRRELQKQKLNNKVIFHKTC